MTPVTQELYIGAWVHRHGLRYGKWHRVESIVAGDALTRCGKRMKDPGVDVYAGAVSRASVPLGVDLCRGGCS